MLNEVMKKELMTKQQFDDLVKQHGLDYVRRRLAGKKKNVSISIENGLVVVKTLKKLHRKKYLNSIVNGIRHQKRQKVIKELQNDINDTIEQNRAWFIDLYEKHYKLKSDVFNKPMHNQNIPDVQNKQFKYVIYVIKNTDWSIKPKTIKYYQKTHYKLLTVVANNPESYTKLIQDLFKIRGHYSHPTESFREYLLTLQK